MFEPESGNIIHILENNPTQERAEYFLQLINFFKILVPYTRNVEYFPETGKFKKTYFHDLKKYDYEYSIGDALNRDPERLAAHIQQITVENIPSDQALFDTIKQLYNLLTTQNESLTRLREKLTNTYNKILENNLYHQKRKTKHLSIFGPVNFAVEQRTSIISPFFNEIFDLYIELEKIVSPKTSLTKDKLYKKVTVLLSQAVRDATEKLETARRLIPNDEKALVGVAQSIISLSNKTESLLRLAESPTSELLQAALSYLKIQHDRCSEDLKKNYPDTKEDQGGIGTKGDYIEHWVSVPSPTFKAGSDVLSIMNKAYETASGLIDEQKIIKENNERKPSRAFFPRPSIKLNLIEPQRTKNLSPLPAEFGPLKSAIQRKWGELKQDMDKTIDKTKEFNQLEQGLGKLNKNFLKTKNLFDLNRIFEPFYSCDLEALESFNEQTNYLKQLLRNFFNFIKKNISRHPAYTKNVFEENIKQFKTIALQVQTNLQGLEGQWALSINTKTTRLYNNFIVQLKKEIINSVHNWSNCSTMLEGKGITPIQALDHLNSLCDAYPNNQTTFNLLVFVFTIITELAVYYPQPIQPILLSLARSVFERVDRNVQDHLAEVLEETRFEKSAQVLASINMINSNSSVPSEQQQEEGLTQRMDVKNLSN